MTTNIDSDPNLMWDTATKCIKNIAKEVQGESKGIRLLEKETGGGTSKFKLSSSLKGQTTKLGKRLGMRRVLKNIGMQKKKLKKW